MTPLPTTYKKNGYDYKQLERTEDVAIYEQYSDGNLIAYEVFEIIKQKEWTAFGKTSPPKEAVPSTEQWGTNAFTTVSLERARYKADYLKKRINERIASRQSEPVPVAAYV